MGKRQSRAMHGMPTMQRDSHCDSAGSSRIGADLPLHTRVQTLRLLPEAGNAAKDVCSIRVSACGDDGICGMTDLRLEPAEPVAMFFPPNGAQRGHDAYGYVTSCKPTPVGFEVAVRFTPERPISH